MILPSKTLLVAALSCSMGLAGCAMPHSTTARPARTPTAQSAPAMTALAMRGEQIVQVINGKGNLAETFAPAFLAQVSEARLAALATSVRASLGAPSGVARVEPTGPHGGTIYVAFAAREVPIRVTLEPQAPYRINGMEF